MKKAFTIVELLVVIVVIGILAAITIVSYTGISNKAILASIQSDLNNSSNQLKLYYTEYSSYPATLNADYCPTAPSSTTKYCLKASSGNTYTYSVATGVTNPQSFSLTATNTNPNYFGVVTNNSKPLIPNNTTAPLSPVADWLAIPTGEHYGNFYDSVTKQYASVTRAGPKTIYDPSTQKIYDVPANQLAINPRSDNKSGYEAVIEEGRTNLLLNSNFETDITGWNYGYDTGGAGSGIRTSDKSVYGSASIKVAKSGSYSGGSWVYPDNISVINGQTYTFSAYVNLGTGADAYLYLYDTQYNNVHISTGTGWQRISITRTVNASFISLRLQNNGNNSDVWFDAVQLEQNSWNVDDPSSYIPTTTSSVTRNADVVTIPSSNFNKSSGSVFITGQANRVTPFPNAFSWQQDYNNQLGLSGQGANTLWFWAGRPGGINLNYATGSELATNAVYVGTWNNGSLPALYINGSKSVATQNYATMSGLPSTAKIGSYGDGITQWNSSISRATIYSSALTDSDVTQVTNTVKEGP
jgi:general secretion pathway protein G